MRILMIHNRGRSTLPSGEALPSGESIVFADEVAALRALAGIDVLPLLRTPAVDESVWARLRTARRLIGSRTSYRAMAEHVARYRPDVVHAHSVLPDWTVSALAACYDAGVPVVQTLHNYRWLCVEGGLYRAGRVCEACRTDGAWQGIKHRCARGSWLASGLLTANNARHVTPRRLWRYVQRFIAVSAYCRDRHVAAGFPADRVVVKYHAVPVPEEKEVLTRHARGPTICFAGRLDAAKGTDLLRDLVESTERWQWRVVGDGPERPLWEQLQRQWGGRLRVLGHLSREDTRAELARAACVVVPSRVPETFGLVAAEAMAAGTPVVVSNRGALPELVAAGGGRVVDPEQGAGAFQAAIGELLAEDKLWQQAANRGRQFVRRTLGPTQLTQRLLAIYQEAAQVR